MEKKSKLVMVNYLNSKPFVHGLESPEWAPFFDVATENPAMCAQKFMDGKADIALVPVGALPDLSDYEIVTDFCIGCDGEVRTVSLFSNIPARECTQLVLDNHSRSSVLLSRLILEEYMGVYLPAKSADISAYLPKKDDLMLLIGDKVFQYEDQYQYHIDLGNAWKEWTGLPFVFAVWIAKKGVAAETIEQLNSALNEGVGHMQDIIARESQESLDLYYYFTHNIKYNLDAPKKEALSLYLAKIKSLPATDPSR